MSKRADDAPRKEVKMYDPNDAVIIGLDTEDGPSHPLYDGESNAAPLIESDVAFTMEHGVIQPVSARRDGKRILIVFGRGRTRQLREANKRLKAAGKDPWLLPVQIVQGDEAKLLALKHGENSHRREINPMARAREAYELSQKMPEERAATILGLGLSQFKNVLKLNGLGKVAARAVTAGKLPETGAVDLAALSEADQEKHVATLTANGHTPTVRDVKAKVREANGKPALVTPAQRIAKALAAIDRLDDGATKEDLWSTIRKIRSALER